MAHDERIFKHEEQIEEIRKAIPSWVKDLQRPPTPVLIPKFGPLEGIRVVSTGTIVAQPYDTFQCQDGWVFIGALGGAIYPRVPTFLGLDPQEYSDSR